MREHQPCTTRDCGNSATGTVAHPQAAIENAVWEVCDACRDFMISTMGYHIIEPIRPTGRDDQTQIQTAIDALPR